MSKLVTCAICAIVIFANAVQPATAAPQAGQIVVDSANPAWFKYEGGGPFFLAGPGDPEDFLYRGSRNSNGTRNGDQDALIDKLGNSGANGIYFQLVRSNGGDGDSTHNPWINNDPSQGLNDAVLDQWDGWFAELDAYGVAMHIFFYDDSTNVWNTGSTVSAEERAFFEAIVNRFENYRHIVWVIAEEYAEALSSTRVSALASIIRAADDRDHPIGVHKNDGLTFNEFASDPNIDQFTLQYNQTSASNLHSGMLTAWDNAQQRYNLNMSEATQWGTGSTARQKAWAVAMGGAYVMGLGMDIASTPTSDLEDLGRLRTFMEGTRFNDGEPLQSLRSADTDYVFGNQGDSYILYGVGSVAQLGLNSMVGGDYSLTWFDPIDGTTIQESRTGLSSGTNSFAKPAAIGNEVALYLVRNGGSGGGADTMPPAAPTQLVIGVSSPPPEPPPPPAPPVSGAFCESGDRVVFEAEHYSAETGYAQVQNSGASNGTVVQVSEGGGQVDYTIQLSNGGKWYVWLRTLAVDHLNNGLFIKIDGQNIVAPSGHPQAGHDAIYLRKSGSTWYWEPEFLDNNEGHNGPVTFETSAGTHTFSISKRKVERPLIDKIVLTRSNQAPADLGPPETPCP